MLIWGSTTGKGSFTQYAYNEDTRMIEEKKTISFSLGYNFYDNHEYLFVNSFKGNGIGIIYRESAKSHVYVLYHAVCHKKAFTVIQRKSYMFQFTSTPAGIHEEFIVFPTLEAVESVYGKISIDDGSSSEVAIELNKQCPFSTMFKYTASTTFGKKTYDYEIVINDPQNDFISSVCSLTVKVLSECYMTCEYCDEKGNDIEHKCIYCKEDYYKYLTDDVGNCYKNDGNLPARWYLYRNLFYSCSLACKGCTGNEGYDNELKIYRTYCLECADDAHVYYALPECRNDAVREGNIFLSPFTKIYNDCFRNCATCSALNEPKTMNCDTCISGKVYDAKTKNCVSPCSNCTPNSPSYYGEYGQDYPCFETCASCSKGGTLLEHNCDSCRSSYYFIQNSHNCEYKDQIITSFPGQYIDNTDKIIAPCFLSCLECKGVDNSSNHN